MKQRLKSTIANPWLKRFILIGYAAKGSLYSLIGILAIQAALVPEQEAAGTYHTLTTFVEQPIGNVFICLLAISLLGYVLRRLLQTVFDPGHSDSLKPKRILQRLGYAMSAISYAGVSYSALNIVFELGEYDDTIEDLVAQLFDQPFGQWLIFLGGIGVVLVGLGYVYGAYTGSYISEFQSEALDQQVEQWAIAMGKIGVSARGVAFVLTGVYLIQAAIFANSEIAGGLENAFRNIESRPLGGLWLGLIGMGFLAYGLYLFVAAVHRRFAVR